MNCSKFPIFLLKHIDFREELMTKEEEIQNVLIENEKLKEARTIAEELCEKLKLENDDLQSRLNEERMIKDRCQE